MVGINRVSGISAALYVLNALLAGSAAAREPRDGQEHRSASHISSAANRLKRLSLEELLDVQVTSVSRRPEKLSATASAIQLITAEDIRRSGATSIPEALRLASNLEVAQIDSRQWAITARGFNNTLANKMLVLIDGRTVYTPLYAGVYWDVQDTLLEDIERIEVISGPGAAQWGANAVNGVINITTKHTRDTGGAMLVGGAGQEQRGFGGLRYGGTLGADAHYRAYVKYSDRDASALPSGLDASDAWRLGQGGVRADWSGGVDAFTAQADVYSGSADQRATAADLEIDGGNVLGRWSRSLAAGAEIKLQMYYDRTHRLIPASIEQNQDTADIDFQHRFALGSQDIVWGLTYRWVDDDIRGSALLTFIPGRVSHQWFGAFVQDEIALLQDRLNLTFGARIEHNDYTGVELQPSVRAAWTLGPERTLWTAVSRAVRTPSRVDRDIFSPAAPPFLILGGDDFRSETMLAYELGYRAKPDPRLALSIATFYHDYDDLRSLEPLAPPAPVPVMLANGLQGRSYGAELTANYHVSGAWRLRLGYTELRTQSEPKSGSLDRQSTRSVSLDPDRQALLRSSFDLPNEVELDASLRYVGALASQDAPAYAELDLRLGWHPAAGLELSIVGQNLLDSAHAEFGRNPTRVEIERGVYAKVVWNF